ncbi:5-formyltetrahydrofolate cyclo-ligase [Nocardiopsis ansamitocini]|uniref:5-formyltetrahydrofolate cyclo-ligase n=1 Tax=Nocardiopsis ansamitocini TaxID=1670832 RepID=A0A9W6P443_9ACTN|nr:5-formyltetrahydrofolate cyclo-ligase [Nocardiopsis ansamitocini]GLU46949.1 5-formyltetrahydrofolate cyclo-ligase [Nocardiopsis ansamitocini]
MNDGEESKRELRGRLLKARRALGEAARGAAGPSVRDALLPRFTAGETVAAYYSVGTEPDTHPLVARLRLHGVRVLLPLFLADGELDWAEYTGVGSLAPAGHGLLEPTGPRLGMDAVRDVAAVLCPALAVDRAGFRLGRGAGCYDRALGRVGPRTPTLAVVYDSEVLDTVPTEDHDRPVGGVVTPGGGVRLFRDG